MNVSWDGYPNWQCAGLIPGTVWTNARGYIYILQGVVYLSIYTPCVIVLTSKAYTSNVGYKFMLALAPLDYFMVFVGSFYFGFCSIVGAPFPEYHRMQAVITSVGVSFWGSYTCLIMVLAFSRFLSLVSPPHFDALFSLRRVNFWIAGCYVSALGPLLVYSLGFGEVVYHSGYAQALNDYCMGSSGWGWVLHFGWNSAVAVLIPVEYAGIVAALRIRAASAELPVTAKERAVMMQALLISYLTALTAVTYVVFPYWFPDRAWSSLFCQLLWQACQERALIGCKGGTGIIYLVFNEGIRNDALVLLRLRGPQVAPHTAQMLAKASRADANQRASMHSNRVEPQQNQN